MQFHKLDSVCLILSSKERMGYLQPRPTQAPMLQSLYDSFGVRRSRSVSYILGRDAC